MLIAWLKEGVKPFNCAIAALERPLRRGEALDHCELGEARVGGEKVDHRLKGGPHCYRPILRPPVGGNCRRKHLRLAGLQCCREHVLLAVKVLIRVNIERERFMINPTSCSEFQTVSEGVGDQGTGVSFSSPFHAVNCFGLPFAPKMSITQLGGHRATARSKDPSLAIELNTSPGEANLKSLTVTLPKAFEIDQRHLGNICDRSELASDQCAGRQPIGEAVANTPLLEAPLKGPVFAVSGFGVLPHLAFILGGQVTLMPQAESSSVQNGRLKTVVPVIPDAPIGNFRFTLFGGSQGYLSNTQSLCSSMTPTTVEFNAQTARP